ncbi:MAG: zinc ribbon domain-containing protein [Trichlorobacter sp.]
MQCPFCKAQAPDGSEKCPQCGTALPPPSSPTSSPQVDAFGGVFTSSTNLWKDNLGDLALVTLVFCLVAWIPFANVGFITGYYRSIIKLVRGQGKPQVGDIFKAWDCFGSLLAYLVLVLIAIVILSVVPLIGSLAGLALSIAITPGLYAIIDRGLGTIDAFKWCVTTLQKDPLTWILAAVVGSILAGVGAIALLIGVIITIPWGTIITATQYERRKND